MTLDLTAAFRIAVDVHGSQRDKAGEPYMFHVCRVAERMVTDEERVVAILHDAYEDANGGTDVLDRAHAEYGAAMVTAIVALSREPNEPYMDYIKRISTNPLATAVKLADLADNTKRYRMEKLSPAERERLRKKYYEAMDYLAKHGALMLGPEL